MWVFYSLKRKMKQRWKKFFKNATKTNIAFYFLHPNLPNFIFIRFKYTCNYHSIFSLVIFGVAKFIAASDTYSLRALLTEWYLLFTVFRTSRERNVSTRMKCVIMWNGSSKINVLHPLATENSMNVYRPWSVLR